MTIGLSDGRFQAGLKPLAAVLQYIVNTISAPTTAPRCTRPAANELLPAIYQELRRLAASKM